MRFWFAVLLSVLLALPAAAQSPSPANPAPRTPPPMGSAPSAASPAPASSAARAPSATASSVDVNLATADELQALAGIGPARSAAIVAHRPYRTLDEVASKASIPASVLAPLRGQLTAVQINVNAASRREMIDALPGVGEARADGIIRGRPYARIEELVSKGGLPQAVFDRIRHGVTLR